MPVARRPEQDETPHPARRALELAPTLQRAAVERHLSRRPTGLADGLALKERRYSRYLREIRPKQPGSPVPRHRAKDSAVCPRNVAASPAASACTTTRRPVDTSANCG